MRRQFHTGALAAAACVLLSFGGVFAGDVRVEKDLVYATPDGTTLRLDAYLPKAAAAPVPAVLVIHGGSWKNGSKASLRSHAMALAEHGFAAFAIGYRLAPKHAWPAQIHDCKAAVRWVRSHAGELGVDPDRIGAMGYSAGGHLATLLAVTDPEDGLDEPGADARVSASVQAVVGAAAPCDFTWMPRRINVLGYWLGGTRKKRPDAYRAASPLRYVDADAAPILFLHGKWDVVVNPRMGPIRTTRALRKAGADVEYRWLRGVGHMGLMKRRETYSLTIDFMRRHLAAPSATPAPKVEAASAVGAVGASMTEGGAAATAATVAEGVGAKKAQKKRGKRRRWWQRRRRRG